MIRRTILSMAVVALAVGCASRAADPGAAPEPGPDEPVGTTIPTSGPEPTPQPADVTPEPGLTDPRPHAWDDAEVVDERTVRLSYYGGVAECYGLAAVDVRYGKREIVITLSEGRRPNVDVCIEIAVLKRVTVELDEPIDGRRIVDGALRSAA